MNNLQANICLLAVTLCWSCEIVLLSALPGGANPFVTTCTTSLIGAILLGICFARRIIAAFRKDMRVLARRIFFLSVLNASYNVLIEMGLEYFDVSIAAFTLSMTVVILPVMLLIMHRGVTVRTWLSALLVLIGIVIAAIPVFSSIPIRGFAVMFVSCIIRALYIVKLSDYVREYDPVAVAAGISCVNAIVTFIPWFIMNPLTFASLPWSPSLIAVFVIYSYFIVAFATVMNAFAQRRATPAQATIIYATEIIFSIVWAVCLPDFIITHTEITLFVVTGCVFIVLGNIMEIIPTTPFKRWVEKRTGLPVVYTEDPDNYKPKARPLESDSNADLVTQILERFKHPIAQKITLFFILLAVYLIISLPFKVLSLIPGFTDIRPVCMLQPVYGIYFGLPGCLAFGIGNVISDIMSDSLRWTSIAGFIGNFAYPYLMYLFWTKLYKKPFHLRSKRMLLAMVASIVACSCIETLIIAPAVGIVYPEVDIVLFTLSCLANTTLFSIAFAIPFMILIQEELGFAPLGKAQEELDALPSN